MSHSFNSYRHKRYFSKSNSRNSKPVYNRLDAFAKDGAGGPVVTFKSKNGTLNASTSMLMHGHANEQLIALFPERRNLIEKTFKRRW